MSLPSPQHTSLTPARIADWDKRNFRLNFHKSSAGASDDQFVWAAGVPAVKSIELHGFFQESGPNSYMRKVRPQGVSGFPGRMVTSLPAQTLAMRFMNQNGVPAPSTRYVRVRQNGAFLGLYLLVELVDASFLKRRGLNTSGHLFKANHWCGLGGPRGPAGAGWAAARRGQRRLQKSGTVSGQS